MNYALNEKLGKLPDDTVKNFFKVRLGVWYLFLCVSFQLRLFFKFSAYAYGLGKGGRGGGIRIFSVI